MSSSIGQNPTFSRQQLVREDCHRWLKFGWKSLGKWQYLQHYKSIIPPTNLQGTTSNVGWTFSVGDTILRFTISIEQDIHHANCFRSCLFLYNFSRQKANVANTKCIRSCLCVFSSLLDTITINIDHSKRSLQHEECYVWYCTPRSIITCCSQYHGRFLGIISHNHSVSKSTWLRVVIFQFFFKFNWSIFHTFLSKWLVIFLKSWTSTGFFSNSTGSSLSSDWVSPFIGCSMTLHVQYIVHKCLTIKYCTTQMLKYRLWYLVYTVYEGLN